MGFVVDGAGRSGGGGCGGAAAAGQIGGLGNGMK